jgi:methylenetetrahydrofolate reductase (NADPH)
MSKVQLSFEVYPPRNPDSAPALYEAIDQLGKLDPRFISVTFGAGGSETKNSLEVLGYIKENTKAVPLAHLTCVGSTSDQASGLVQEFLDAGIDNFLALRGDLPLGVVSLPEASLSSAAELVSLIRKVRTTDGLTAVAAFPNGHPESGSDRNDIAALLAKQAAGADFAITQLFFHAADYFNFVDQARGSGVTIPVVPGIMPLTSAKRLARVLELTGEREPQELSEGLTRAKDAKERTEVGVSYAARLIRELEEGGVPGVHLYAFNEYQNVTEVLRRAELV